MRCAKPDIDTPETTQIKKTVSGSIIVLSKSTWLEQRRNTFLSQHWPIWVLPQTMRLQVPRSLVTRTNVIKICWCQPICLSISISSKSLLSSKLCNHKVNHNLKKWHRSSHYKNQIRYLSQKLYISTLKSWNRFPDQCREVIQLTLLNRAQPRSTWKKTISKKWIE